MIVAVHFVFLPVIAMLFAFRGAKRPAVWRTVNDLYRRNGHECQMESFLGTFSCKV